MITRPLVFLDTETTGLEDGRLVELYADNGEERACDRFKPPVPISIEAMATHHITEKMVENYPPFAGSVAFGILTGMVSEGIIVAHNAPFDIGVLEREGVKVGEYIDTKRIAQRLLPDFPSHSMQYLRYAIGLEVEAEAHSAAGDVKVLKAVFSELVLLMRENNPGMDEDDAVDTMCVWTHEPVLLKTISFGKHRGKTWEQVAKEAPDYIEWVMRQDFDGDVRHTAKHWLADRAK
jgi:exodeoxyribonuclease X